MDKCDEIGQALGGKRASNGWMCPCPAHDDKNASLSVRYHFNPTKARLHCFTGCEFKDIVKALENRGLWQSVQDPNWQEKARERRRQEKIQDCKIFIQVYESPRNASKRTDQDKSKYQQCRKLLK